MQEIDLILFTLMSMWPSILVLLVAMVMIARKNIKYGFLYLSGLSVLLILSLLTIALTKWATDLFPDQFTSNPTALIFFTIFIDSIHAIGLGLCAYAFYKSSQHF